MKIEYERCRSALGRHNPSDDGNSSTRLEAACVFSETTNVLGLWEEAITVTSTQEQTCGIETEPGLRIRLARARAHACLLELETAQNVMESLRGHFYFDHGECSSSHTSVLHSATLTSAKYLSGWKQYVQAAACVVTTLQRYPVPLEHARGHSPDYTIVEELRPESATSRRLELMSELSDLFFRLGEVELHRRYSLRAYRSATEHLGPFQPQTLCAAQRYALSLILENHAAEAIPILEDAEGRQVDLLGEDHPDVFLSRASLVAAYIWISRPSASLRLLGLLEQSKRHCIPGIDRDQLAVIRADCDELLKFGPEIHTLENAKNHLKDMFEIGKDCAARHFTLIGFEVKDGLIDTSMDQRHFSGKLHDVYEQEEDPKDALEDRSLALEVPKSPSPVSSSRRKSESAHSAPDPSSRQKLSKLKRNQDFINTASEGNDRECEASLCDNNALGTPVLGLWPAFFAAIYRDHVKVVDVLLRRASEELTRLSPAFETALFLAVKNGQAKVLHLLLLHHKKHVGRTTAPATALHMAVRWKKPDIIRTVLAAASDSISEQQMQNILLLAIAERRHEEVAALLSKDTDAAMQTFSHTLMYLVHRRDFTGIGMLLENMNDEWVQITTHGRKTRDELKQLASTERKWNAVIDILPSYGDAF